MPRLPGTVRWLTAMCCLIGSSGPGWAADAPAPSPTPPTSATAGSAAATAPARRVVRDPQTGELRAPTAAEAQAMQAQAVSTARSRWPATTTVRQHPTGMRSAVVGSEHLVTLQAQRRPDGSLQVRHSDPALDPAAPAAPSAPTE